MQTSPASPSSPAGPAASAARRSSRLAADGFAVVVGYAGNREPAEAAVKEVTAAGGRAIAVQADVADEQEVAALFDTAESAYGGVDVVVHAAGRMYLAPIADLDLAELDALHRTNIRGHLRRRPAGRPPGARRRRDRSPSPPRSWAWPSPATAPTAPARAPSRRSP